eukprot:CAMPEP_0172578744 /NCGR_PEP_ID=MMETSP1067-20121228/138889_1 /TAXON_ID=265564 ORGANISM="Thalassiosira punctigera, Strain Tpunct2005C2" /NCGR_SAMPLE_ID=MMETSP1067 /ASSEMBLY_ACC=CAM_ASM_000444 /LENGTH=446 /DNA_ID=CAMNT_0013371443 /DNA_START=43 /DNA_END=1383 /DNA_ORIENTATION=+
MTVRATHGDALQSCPQQRRRKGPRPLAAARRRRPEAFARPTAAAMMPIASLVFLFQSLAPSSAFAAFPSRCHSPSSGARARQGIGGPADRLACDSSRFRRNSCSLNLVPFSEAWNANDERGRAFSSLLPTLGCPSFNSEGMLIHTSDDENRRYRLYLATDEDDLPPITQLTIDVFDATAITLSSDWSALERAVIGPAAGAYNAYAQAVAYTEVLSGLRKRMRNRIRMRGDDGDGDVDGTDDAGYDWLAPLAVPDYSSGNGSDDEGKATSLEEIAARSSLVLALARPSEEGGEMEAVASVELRLQPADAKIPFSQPWLDEVERKIVRLVPFAREERPVMTTNESLVSDGRLDAAPSKNPPLRPYLCNLCVSPRLRSLGIGRALCRIVEAVARERWGYSRVYLHVDPENDAARGLYENEGYVDVGRRWDVFWAGGASGISYYVKRLGE